VAERRKKKKYGLRSEIISFGELLSGAMFFTMPYLQRPYEWTELEVSEMVSDLLASCQAHYTNYVLGHIIGLRGSGKDIEIVDGQQRLVTMAILLAYLRDRLKGRSSSFDSEIQSCVLDEGRPRVTPRPVDAPFLRDLFQSRDSGQRLAAALVEMEKAEKAAREDKQAKVRLVDPQSLMLNAAFVVRRKLDRLGLDALQQLAEFILDQGVVDFIVADDRTQAAILYRSMNMRGRKLSTADLIKLEAIEHAGLDPATKDKAARVWEEAEDRLGRVRFAQLLDMLPLLVSRERTKQPGNLQEWRERAFRNIRADTLLLTMLPLYAGVMEELLSGEIYADCESEEDRRALAETNSLLQGLLHLQDRHWLAPAMSIVYARREHPQFLLRYFRGLDRLSYTFFLGATRHDDRAERFARIVAAGDDEVQLEAAFEIDAEECAEVARRLRRPFARDPWRRRAIASRVNAALPNGRNFAPREDITVEHVLPTNHCKVWEAIGWSAAAQRECSELLGNWVIVTAAQNNRAGQRPLAFKLDVYFNTTGAPVHVVTEDVRGVADWTEERVRARTDAFARALLAYWNIRE
jgi:Protein of unknown function DUF262/Protein of unknown function (DUF1524)